MKLHEGAVLSRFAAQLTVHPQITAKVRFEGLACEEGFGGCTQPDGDRLSSWIGIPYAEASGDPPQNHREQECLPTKDEQRGHCADLKRNQSGPNLTISIPQVEALRS
jgi:hypothetical protein